MNIRNLLSDWQNRLAPMSAFGSIADRADEVRQDMHKELERIDILQGSLNSQREEAIQLALSYAKDIVDFFPQFTIRQIPVMAAKVKALKEALEMVK